MLSKTDKKWIEDKFKEYLFRTITIEKSARGPGDKEKTVETSEEYIMDVLAVYFPRMEGAWRGVQEDIDKMKNRMSQLEERVDKIGLLMDSLSDTIITNAKFAIALKETGLLKQMEKVLLVKQEAEKNQIGLEE